jgi:myo-inositol 2-dehydrogenase/D-chiro-inositol 1-dehydrogenase
MPKPMQSAASLAAAALVAPPVHAAGSDILKIGLVGCGGRGSGAALQALTASKQNILHAMGDVFEDFQDRSFQSISKKFPEQVKLEDRKFLGFDAYQKVIDSGVDVVILASPPGFRPAQLKAAVEAGKHIFCEKPMAVDAPGYRSVLESVELSKKKNLCLVAGFCWRYSTAERVIFDMIHNGRIGQVQAMNSFYNNQGSWLRPRQPNDTDMHYQVRNWHYFTWLDGDFIVEQSVHTIDKLAWAMKDEMPIKATGTGGRQTRIQPYYGHVFDHFAINYEWKNGMRGLLFCRQQDGCATDVTDHFFGTGGIAHINGGGQTQTIAGEKPWAYDGPRNNMYQTEHDELFAAIRDGKIINDGVRMANSTMMAILGRMCAYTGQTITWDQAINSKETLAPAKLEWGPMPMPPVAMPGKTKFF